MAKQKLRKNQFGLAERTLAQRKAAEEEQKHNSYYDDTDTINDVISDWNIHPLMNENIKIFGIDWAKESDI